MLERQQLWKLHHWVFFDHFIDHPTYSIDFSIHHSVWFIYYYPIDRSIDDSIWIIIHH
ncbi:hypothetical protein PICMEDRAFT_14887 [Pichia membranifaciens NRRL Y-2026]|uniref:Uncharacterized protein n=1 Tax=Pichia membranifaciens NRRL Y-2026 TaxID=763406 RepID=A0A1E3NTQ5_9ASCO|nr:hypothetical protein PICMEDRAFT_14887 [Pichia membranifaciens NRRL Y-2026]ODQ49429.1 hypothetical protein PICMEDRAFT_14887 [Pichia membranifaciens NRRL Y-2026]